MLKFMRKHATGYMIKAMFGLIIIVFIFWGVGGFRGADKTIAEVGPYKVSMLEYQETYKKLLNFYRMLYKEKLDENVMKELKMKEKTMDQIVDKYVLLTKAAELGLTVSEKEFLDYLAGIDTFKRDGKFDPKVYAEVLNRSNMDPKYFEASEKASMLTSKLMAVIRDTGVYLTDADVYTQYLRDKGQVNLAYLVFEPSDFKGKAAVDEKEVAQVYEKEKDSHKSENMYRLKYLLIDEKSSIKDSAVYEDLLKKKDIEAYGKEMGLEVFDLGSLKRSEVLKRLKSTKPEEWLKGLRKGDVSLPVRVDSKSYLFQVVDMEEGKPIEKSIVLNEIQDRLAYEKAKGLARVKAEEAIQQKSVTGNNETGFVPRNNPNLPKIGPMPKEDSSLLHLSDKRPIYEKPVQIGGRFYVFAYKGEKVPDKQEWEKEKEGYTRYIIARTQDEFLRSFLEELKKKTKVNINWQEF
jgi:peptidyl-prolyl cis-trans isomerase D